MTNSNAFFVPDWLRSRAMSEREFRALLDRGDAAAAHQHALAQIAAAEGDLRKQWSKSAALACLKRNDSAGAYEHLAASGGYRFGANDFYNFGLACDGTGRYEEAVANYRRALSLAPDDPNTLNNMGRTLDRLGQFDEAEALLRRALELTGGKNDNAHLNLAFSLLTRGRWAEGWPHYEARLKVYAVMPEMPYPLWDGKALSDTILLLRAEQGLGDAIQFSRFAMLMGAAAPVVLQVPASLVPLMKSLANVHGVIGADQVIKSEKRIVWLPLLSVPGKTGITPECLPAPRSYLSAEPSRVERWREWLPRAGFRIGINWQGSAVGDIDRGRSVPLALFEPLAGLPDVRLVSLQKGFGTEQIAEAPFRDRLLVPPEDFDTAGAFLDTAALMMSLDLIITTDTAVAHLAGALGRPTFLLLKHIPDWRWLLDREDTPWYPTMRLFRQRRRGDWHQVFERLTAAVAELRG
ncbi:MAG TPA: tetratricopeptide repeat protein [Rhizomicrobium sp.]